MSSNFDGIKKRKFGIEIEMTGLTRSQAAKAMANVLDGRVEHEAAMINTLSRTPRTEGGR